MDRGVYGPLESCEPPITVPAWSCMMSSKDPGTLGFYGFRNRKDHSYDGLTFATAEKVKDDRVWDILSRAGKHVVVLGVPQTFPPRQVNGEMISCFLAPSTDSPLHLPRGSCATRSSRSSASTWWTCPTSAPTRRTGSCATSTR